MPGAGYVHYCLHGTGDKQTIRYSGLCARTALIFCLRSSTSLQYSTGAAHITFLVKQPAATAGSSATTRDRSAFLPDARREAYTPAQAKSAAGQRGAAGNGLPVLLNAQPAAAVERMFCPASSVSTCLWL